MYLAKQSGRNRSVGVLPGRPLRGARRPQRRVVGEAPDRVRGHGRDPRALRRPGRRLGRLTAFPRNLRPGRGVSGGGRTSMTTSRGFAGVSWRRPCSSAPRSRAGRPPRGRTCRSTTASDPRAVRATSRSTIDDRPGASAREERLRLRAGGRQAAARSACREHSGVRVHGADRADFEVLAVQGRAATARGLDAIAVSQRRAARSRSAAPPGEDWVGYLLIAAPAAAPPMDPRRDERADRAVGARPAA